MLYKMIVNCQQEIALPGVRHQPWIDINVSLKKFKKQVGNAGILKEIKKRKGYLKPSKAKRLKHKMHLKRLKREEIRANYYR